MIILIVIIVVVLKKKKKDKKDDEIKYKNKCNDKCLICNNSTTIKECVSCKWIWII